ncbi:CDF family Co(II)/Ni(II) efflux transporter DmeF (plasmid) [Azospirillum oryzae]|uniref:CDF family Co(II)/Ni(II) efflux transporter DmeF n=1 Tax=Azospirillum oryzae TaxID=286727 RepID=A0A6N1AU44_9PROT|nr:MULTISPECIES: CDF family Co(II)/Ni(II) efflux transporter DmeF [Azospirillum]KAA0585379.1 CDF family Co(II)/Ni(II) efflux transporter DmeF [Azospirillum oryzae]PWC83902.1 cation transporter [Azospirillum sp. TSO5]QCG99393.1 CDF family Co(II)/Ni(II) efflux transporter DmeF [Azospirillum sp. TSA2s]QKS54803.1 CDF family Co(II)/Ni(II) efflux transporter DmeF [Azospirillum oryzae]GLR77389.1 cation efflux system protein [Azospirillum oryzae]
MHSHSIDTWTHRHEFLGEHHDRNERRIWIVVALTLVMMVGEIVGGTVFGSLALVADGWHMSTHAAALSISALAYVYARRHARNERFAFGTGKLGELAAFASAIILAMIALLIGYESVERLVNPVPIAYGEAIAIAVLGLAVNLGSAWLLGGEHHHHGHGHHHDHGAHEDHRRHDHHHADGHDGGHKDHPHGHEHGNEHGHGGHHAHDLNMRSAYVHVLADAATSVLAILGLLAAGLFGWTWMDPIVGLVGTAVILSWAYGLIRDAGAVLLDTVPDPKLATAIRSTLETGGDRVTDLHLWRVGPGHLAAIVALVSDHPKPVATYKARLADLHGLSHVTVEVAQCGGHHSGTNHDHHPHIHAA